MNYELKKNTYLATPKDHWPDKIEVEIGDSKEPDVILPQQKICRWDNESNVSLRLLNFNEYSVIQDKDKVIFGNEKQEVHIYPITEGEGGQEFEVILNEKPLTNIIQFSLVDKDVEYFYQPELTQEEKDKGASRPENVVGSYAVYASENKINYVGGKEYKCGKVGHIFRPKIIDSVGNWVWGELKIDKDLLTVTIPQEFLDNAVYPVRHAAGLTFGYETGGGTTNAIAITASGTPYSVRISTFVSSPASNGTLDNLKAYLKASNDTEAVDVTAYVNQKDSGGANSHGQIATKETLNLSVTTTVDWFTFVFASEAVTSGIDYILNVLGNGSDIVGNFHELDLMYDTVAGDYYSESKFGSTGYTDNKENPWTNTINPINSRKHSIYCTYTAGGGGTAIKDIISNNSLLFPR